MRCNSTRAHLAAALATLFIVAGAPGARAQDGAPVTGRITDAQALALPGVAVVLGTPAGGFVASATTDRAGEFLIPDVASGKYVLVATLLGFETHEELIAVGSNGADIAITLKVGAFEQEVTVSALMPEVATELIITAGEIERRVAQDLAQSLRDHAGVTALRRGAINLDPSVRGLYAEQIGVFVDGTRTFAAGPARMDSGLSHVSPHALQSLHVVRGPYALTWGAGTLSAIRADTFKPAFSGGAFELGGRAGYNYGSNGGANDALASLYGSSDRLRFTFQHNTRTGNDYTDGAGAAVQGDYESFDTRWSLGGRLTGRTLLEYTGGYQKQNDIDYPGRILDAGLFETQSHALEFSHARPTGLVSEVAGQVYLNAKTHVMNNDNKPTAVRNPQRTPPFPIDVHLPTSSDTLGGRFHAALETGPLSYKLGFDAYRLQQNATQTITDRDTGQIHHNMHPVWPDAEMTNIGAYAQVVYDRGRSSFGGTLRVDREQARVGGVTQFFAANAVPAYGLNAAHGSFHPQAATHGMHAGGHGTSGQAAGHDTGHGPAPLVSGDAFAQNNVNVSAAANASLRVTDTWLVRLGAGRAVRSPSALERYADRFPAIKFQTAAEFVGNPLLVPEKSVEVNAGTTLRVARATLEGDVFWRAIDDYITVAHDPNLSRRLPLSPSRVFRYVQADSARFIGLDLRAESAAGPWLSLRGAWSFVRAEDRLFDEPLFGIPPFEQRYAVDIHNPARTRWIELQITNTAAQNRVATARLEMATTGWTTVDLTAGGQLVDDVTLRAGIRNLTDEFYVNHLNSLDPFSGRRIAEIGRSGYVGLEFAF